jgi:hypothetical protein
MELEYIKETSSWESGGETILECGANNSSMAQYIPLVR